MKHLFLIAFLGIITFASCNGKTTKTDSLKKSGSKFKDTIKPLEIVEYIPKEYSEIQTDTILSNGLKVSIKTYSNMEKAVVQEKDTVSVIKHAHRKWISEVTVEKEGALIFKEVFDDTFFNTHMDIDVAHLLNSINLETAINKEHFKSTDNYVLINTGLTFPKEDKQVFYTIKIDSKGNYSIVDLNNLEETI